MASDSGAEPMPSEKPVKATEAYVLDNLLMPCLMPGTPRRIGEAILALLLKRDHLASVDGHIELPNDPGVTLAFPPEARSRFRSVLLRIESQGPPWDILAYFIAGTGATGSGALGSGALGSGGSHAPAFSYTPPRPPKERLDRLRWNRQQDIEAFGIDALEEAAVLVDYRILVLEERAGKPSSDPTTRSARAERQGHAAGTHASVDPRRDGSVSGGPGAVPTFKIAGGIATLQYAGKTVQLPTSKGLEYLGRLLSTPGKAIHVVTLAGVAVVPMSQDEQMDELARKDAKARIKRLGERIEDAKLYGDQAKLESLQAEHKQIIDQLASAMGLHGRARSFRTPADNARSNVGHAISRALKKIGEVHSALFDHLKRCLRNPSGMTPCYDPDVGPPASPAP